MSQLNERDSCTLMNQHIWQDTDIYQREMGMIEERETLNIISLLKLQPIRDGNQYCFLWGANLQGGIAGFGDTVEKAAKEFNENYYKELK